MTHLVSGHSILTGPLLGAIRSSLKPVGAAPKVVVKPFVTISREAGGGGRSVGTALAKLLTERDHGKAWQVYDRALVEKVAADHRLEATVVEALEDQHHSWVKDLLSGLAGPATEEGPDELKVLHRVAATARALADVGEVILVGRGAVFVTAGLPGGTHIRLIAPLAHRVRQYAAMNHLSLREAEETVVRLDANRKAFLERFWPERSRDPLRFTATFNTAHHPPETIAAAILPLVGH